MIEETDNPGSNLDEYLEKTNIILQEKLNSVQALKNKINELKNVLLQHREIKRKSENSKSMIFNWQTSQSIVNIGEKINFN